MFGQAWPVSGSTPIELVSAPPGLHVREPLAPEAKDGVGLGPRRDAKPSTAVEGRDFDLSPEGGPGDGDRPVDDEVSPVPFEDGVAERADDDVQISGTSPRVSRLPLPPDAQLHAVRGPRGNFDLQG